jgi:hypothetical protein
MSGGLFKNLVKGVGAVAGVYSIYNDYQNLQKDLAKCTEQN